MEATKRDRGMVRIDENECKGCGLCIEACPANHFNNKDQLLGTPASHSNSKDLSRGSSGQVLKLSDRLNHYGYRTALYAGTGCTGCGICFMACPEPGAITVLRRNQGAEGMAAAVEVSEGELACASN